MFSAWNAVSLLVVVVSLTRGDSAPAAEPDCEVLVRPLALDNHGKIEGRWNYVEGFAVSDSKNFAFGSGFIASSWINVTVSPEDNITYTMMEYNRNNGTCEVTQIRVTPVSGSNTIMEMAFSIDDVIDRGTFLSTCADCLLFNFTSPVKPEDPVHYLQMYMREGSSLKEADRHVFEQQAKCLNFNHHYKPTQERCTEDESKVIPWRS